MEEENINEEGRREVERLRQEYVITEEELRPYREQRLLRSLYDCQDEMGLLLDEGQKDPDYLLISEIIKRLEKYIQNRQDLK